MKVVVAGGTGFIGKRLVRALVSRGDDVVVITRKERPSDNPHVRFAAPMDERLLASELEGATAIVGLAGAGVMDERWTDARKRELRQSRVQSTSSLARAAIASKVRIFVSASAIGIYGMAVSDEPIEDAVRSKEPEHGSDLLAKVCEEWEAAANPARAAGIRVTHPRIGIVLGPDGGALASMIPPFKAFVGGPIGTGKQWVSWIHIDDMVNALLFAIDDVRLSGPYNCTAPNPVQMDKFAHELGHALGRPAKIRTPAIALKLAMGERAEVILNGRKILPTRLQSLGFPFKYPDVIPALEEIIPQPGAPREGFTT